MSTKSRHNDLSSDDRSQIRSAILSSREMLESEFERQLERYGVYDDDRVPLSKLGHLSLQDRETRREIDAALERELEATEDYQRAYRNYIREATKEYLNRCVGLKTIEARGLVTETLTTKAEYGNRSYLHYTVDEIAGELTDASDDGLGVALDLAFQEIGAEIRILFEDIDYTAIEPEFTVRRDVFEELGKLDDDAWAADEAIGWVYQYFGEKEREEIDKRISDENYKVQDTDIATKTQLFTPRYIVEWMVDNSLGRLWLEMYGDETNIDDEDICFHLTPLEQSLIDRETKDVRDIKVLDPACGSGHMLFYAFDVLYQMYLEQGDVPEKYIPREILKNNLYGIDIDDGAAQIAALALYVKAKSHAQEVAIEGMNIISANAVLVNGEKKQEVLQRTNSELERRVIEQVWTRFEHIREWGSLVRIEEQIEEIIESELEEVKSTGQTQFTNDGLAKQSSVVSFSGEEESWEQVKNRLLEQVTELAEKALEQNDPIEEMFAEEVEKSVRLLDVFVEKYDVVVSNPPYLSSSKMGDTLKKYLKNNYLGNRDLYTAFIERCTELSHQDSYITMVTPESFMFLNSHKKIRRFMVTESQIIEGAHLSRYGFDQAKDSYTIPFVLRNSDPGEFESSRFYRMTHEQKEYENYEDKIRGLTEITSSHRNGSNHEDVYTINQGAFAEIDSTPIVYWFGTEILDLFIEKQKLGANVDVVGGITTGDDDRFIRNWWEIKKGEIPSKYSWIFMSGDDNLYYDSPDQTIFWENDGHEVVNYDGSYPRNKDHYGKCGLNFRRFGNLFTARHHPRRHIFSSATRFVYSGEDKKTDLELLGYLCSTLTRFIINGINPTINFQPSDAKTLPFSQFDRGDDIRLLVESGIDIQKKKFSHIESKREFSGDIFIDSIKNQEYYLDEFEADIQIIHGLLDKIFNNEYGLSQDTIYRIYKDLPENLCEYPHVKNVGEINKQKRNFRDKIPTTEYGEKEYQNLVSDISEMNGEDLREVAEELEVSPHTVVMIRREYDLYTRDEQRKAAGRLLSYYLGVLFGRWENVAGRIDYIKDGILVFDDQFDENVTDRIRECIEVTFDDVYEKEAEIEDLLNKNMTDWLRETFFRYHHCKEYRRRGQRIPIYWQLESENGAFSCFLYYHEMDADTLPKLRGQYVDTKIDVLRNRLGSIESEFESATDDKKRELRNEMEKLQEQLDDVQDFGDRLDALIDDGFEPDFEAGIWKNIQKVDEYDLLQTELDKL